MQAIPVDRMANSTNRAQHISKPVDHNALSSFARNSATQSCYQNIDCAITCDPIPPILIA